MNNKFAFLLLILIPVFHSCQQSKKSMELVLPSPDSKVHLYFNLNNGEPYYLVYFNKDIIIDWSLMGFIVVERVNLTEGLGIKKTESKSIHSVEAKGVNNSSQFSENYNELSIFLQKENDPTKQFIILFRAYNNGIAFTYLFPENEEPGTVSLVSEETQFDLYGTNSNWKPILENDSLGKISQTAENFNNEISELPTAFISSNKIRVTFSEILAKGCEPAKLQRRTVDKPEYKVRFRNDISTNGIELERSLYSSWRLILIQKD
jgi:alpha-glucosidase